MEDFIDDEFEEFMSYELTHDDDDEEKLICEICGQEFDEDGEQISERVLCPDCRLFEFDDD